MKKDILFVCTGNTCRSPIAEAVFRRMLKEENLEGDYNCSSAGVYAFEGDCASYEAVSAARQDGLDITVHYARTLSYDMVKNAYIILTMTSDHKRMVTDEFPEARDKAFTVKEFAEYSIVDRDITDPFGMGENAYLACAREIKTVLLKILDKL